VNGADLQSALSELTAILGGGDQDDDETGQQQQLNLSQSSQQDGGGGGGGKILGMNAAEFQFQFDEDKENPDEILERFRDEIGEAGFRLLLQNSEEGEPVQLGGQGNPVNTDIGNLGKAQHFHQPTSRADSRPHPAPAFGAMSEFSGSSPPTRHVNDQTREYSQSTSPSSSDYNRDVDMLQMSENQISNLSHWVAGRAYSRSRGGSYGVGAGSHQQAGLLDDPIRAAERERVRGENRVRKKRWRESNQDRSKWYSIFPIQSSEAIAIIWRIFFLHVIDTYIPCANR
jgi:hypothetical protein